MSLVIILSTNNAFADTGSLLIILAINVISLKIKNHKWMTIIEVFVIILATYQNPVYAYFFGMLVYKLISEKTYLAVMPVLLATYVFSSYIELEILISTMALCAYFAYSISVVSDKALSLEKKHDNERVVHSDVKIDLSMRLDSLDKVEHLAKLSERSRISMDFHDNIRHSIAGVLMQLQAAKKIEGVNKRKAEELYETSTKKLARTLDMLREIVHDMQPADPIGIEHIKKIIEDFNFCEIDAIYTGNFTNISVVYLEIIIVILKEAVTNITKHSKATKVIVKLDLNDKFLRLYIKDNGLGCESITENLGVRSMRNRVQNIGGNFSIGNDNGIVIVSVFFLAERSVCYAHINS
ncbi:MAG: histidine kinase [Clostridiales bacterium]|nr:histidine kinase [Clostridiales bacterium]